MNIVEKYPRTYHFPFSPGRGSDDKILHDWVEKFSNKSLILTEKMDGGNTQINKQGVFARSISGPTDHPSFDHLKAKWSTIQHDLGDLCLFGENLFAIHSIEYTNLKTYFCLFAVKNKDTWLGWDEVKFWANFFEWNTVPVLGIVSNPDNTYLNNMEKMIASMMKSESSYGGPMEGIVLRNANEFKDEDFSNNVIKYVRANHVQTDQHWTKNWKQADLNL